MAKQQQQGGKAVEMPAQAAEVVAVRIVPAEMPRQRTPEEMEAAAAEARRVQSRDRRVALRAELDRVEAELKQLGDPAKAPREAADKWLKLVETRADLVKQLDLKIIEAATERRRLEMAAQEPLLRKTNLERRRGEIIAEIGGGGGEGGGNG